MGMQAAEQEYLALSCQECRDIKLLDLNKQNPNSGTKTQYEVITAFSGEGVGCMYQGEEKRIFVKIWHAVQELDTSTTTFTKVRSIGTGRTYGYVPDPHRLFVVRDKGDICALSYDNNIVVWRIEESIDFHPSHVLYVPNHDAVLVAHRLIKITVLDPGSGSEIQTLRLPHYIYKIKGMCLVHGQIIVLSEGVGEVNARISYFSLK